MTKKNLPPQEALVDGGVALVYKKFGSIHRLTLAGRQRPRHIIQGNNLYLSPGEGVGLEGIWGDLLILRGERGRGGESVVANKA